MTRLTDAFSLMPNPADAYTLDHEPTRAELADWCDRVKAELIIYARFRYGATAFADLAPLDEETFESYLQDALSEATAPAWRKIR
jgi:hypothetical protein